MYNARAVTVVQWIEYGPPKAVMWVRFPPVAPSISESVRKDAFFIEMYVGSSNIREMADVSCRNVVA